MLSSDAPDRVCLRQNFLYSNPSADRDHIQQERRHITFYYMLQDRTKNCKMEQRNQTTIADRYLPLAALCAVATRTHRHAALHGMYRRPWVAARVEEGHCALILSRGGAGLAAARCSCGAYHRVASWRGPWVVWCYKLIDEK